MITENVSTLKIHKLTQAQYERELEAGRIDENALYLTPDEEIDLSPYATIEQMKEKAEKEHTHAIADVDNLQSTLDTMNVTISGKANTNHSHAVSDVTNLQETLNENLQEAKSYTDTKTSDLASITVVDTKISTHNTSTSAHNDIRVLISDITTKLNNFLDVDDTTSDQLSEVLEMINNNKGTLESLTTSKVNVSDIIDNLETASTNKVLSANQGVAIKKLIDDLQTAVNGKVPTSRTINNKPLTGDITLSASDVNADPSGSASNALDNAKEYTNNSITTALGNYYTKSEIENLKLITVDDIDAICGTIMQVATASEVMF
jgi:hypothetical protein